MRGATLESVYLVIVETISTHTPLAGRDEIHHAILTEPNISTHTPLAGRDVMFIIMVYTTFGFQLTRPLRGATVAGK